MKKPKTLPTHADEIDVLRLHNAAMQMAELQQRCAVAVDKFAKLLNDAERKYKFSHQAGEGIDYGTREIHRKPESVKPDGD